MGSEFAKRLTTGPQEETGFEGRRDPKDYCSNLVSQDGKVRSSGAMS